MSLKPFNPLDKRNLGISVAKAMMARPAGPLPPLEPFEGAGIYAIYYTGDFPAYRRLSDATRSHVVTPIYVGKAVPAGARKGGLGLDVEPGKALFNRLREHAESVRAAANLDLYDFMCGYLVVDDIWIPLAESLLIERFAPVWNRRVDGFGNHDPGAGRREQQVSPWDVLHPGRGFAAKQRKSDRSVEEILRDVGAFLDGWTPPDEATW